MGLGDLGVFLFFGLLSTCGAYYLQTQTLTAEVFSCGVAIGLPCVGVLNLNNLRDMTNDRKHGKRTLASLLGEKGGRFYHSCLLAACLIIFVLYGHWWTLLVCPVWAWHLWFVWSHDDHLDRQMPVLMFSTLAVAILACL
jgi:1,4-dihydroxy-2-naphthoate octaprenyltransferase